MCISLSVSKKLIRNFVLKPSNKVNFYDGFQMISIKDLNSQITFIIDTGSPFSIIPFNGFSSIPFTSCTEQFLAANDTPIDVFGTSYVNLKFDFLPNQDITWNFFRAKIAFPILGLDFLQSNRLFIDCYNKKLIPFPSNFFLNNYSTSSSVFSTPRQLVPFTDQSSSISSSKQTQIYNDLNKVHSSLKLPSCKSTCTFADCNSSISDKGLISTTTSTNPIEYSSVSTQTTSEFTSGSSQTTTAKLTTVVNSITTLKSPYQQLLSTYPEITQNFSLNTPIKHKIFHKIITTGPPVKTKSRRLNPTQLSFLETHIQELLDAGLIERSSSPWASAIHLVSKPDGTYRMCGDYRALNSITVPDTYPIPFIQDFTNKIYGSTIFTKLDLTKAYFHIPIWPEDIQKTTIVTPIGAYQYKRMNFGLKNATATWSLFIGVVLEGISFVFYYLDDILIFSKDESQHLNHLSIVFNRLRDYGLLLNVDKCVFAVPELDYLGHTVSSQGVRPQRLKVKAIEDFPTPKTQRQLRNFLGLITFYHKFLKNCSLFLAPLHKLVDHGKASDKPISLNETQLKSFKDAKLALTENTMLVHPIPGAEISIACDSSSHTIAGVLQQLQDGEWFPLAFCSRKLTDAEVKYSTFSRELLAIYFCLHKLRYFIEGRIFYIFTDHKPICSAIKNTSRNHLPRELRHLEYISQFTTDIRFVKGVNNIAPDALSRIQFITPQIVIDYSKIAFGQQDDQFWQLKNQDNFNFKHIVGTEGYSIWVDTSTGRNRPYIPVSLRFDIFKQIHNLSHPGVRASRNLIKQRFLWPAMNTDIKQWVKSCASCQCVKISKHTKTPLQPIVEPDSRFEKIHLDLIHLPLKNGYKFVLTIIDRFSRWPEAIPLQEASSESVITAFINIWIARFGIPKFVTTDNATIFCSATWSRFMFTIGTKHIKTSTYHPISNGIIERFNRTLKQALTSSGISCWVDCLPWVLLGLRSTIKADLDFSPTEILYGCQLHLPGDFFEDGALEEALTPSFVTKLKLRLKDVKYFFTKYYNSPSFVPEDLNTCTHVYVRDDSHTISVRPAYLGPFKVLSRSDKCMTLLDYGSVSLDRVKPAFF